MKELYKIYFRLILIACVGLGIILTLHGYNEVEDSFDGFNYAGVILICVGVALTVIDELNNKDKDIK